MSRKPRTRPTKIKFQDFEVRNKFELRAIKDIINLKGLDVEVEYETEKLEYKIEATYCPDFIINRPDGTKTYIETKGRFPYPDQRKMRAVKESHPELDIRIVFERQGKVHKRSMMTYTDWADKHGFQWAIGEVPKEWVR